MPDEVLYGTYYAIPYTGAYGQEGGVLLDGNAMETSLPPSPSETSDLVYDDVTPPGRRVHFWGDGDEYGPSANWSIGVARHARIYILGYYVGNVCD